MEKERNINYNLKNQEKLKQLYFYCVEENLEDFYPELTKYYNGSYCAQIIYSDLLGVYILQYGSCGEGWTDLCNIEFYTNKREVLKNFNNLR